MESTTKHNQEERRVFDFRRNPRQLELFNAVDASVRGDSPVRFFYYGGGIRSGKTSATLNMLLLLAGKYPGYKIAVVRDSLPSIKRTTIKSFRLEVPAALRQKFNLSDYTCELPNGSTFEFISEDFKNDKDLDKFKGYEYNSILLEEASELQQQTYYKAIERLGSWRPDKGWPSFLFATFNPAHNWIKDFIYERSLAGKLRPDELFINALPSDNPFVTNDQWDSWKNMDAVSYRRFVQGDWNARPNNNLFAYGFDPGKHVAPVDYDPGDNICFSFDFNIDPMTCVVLQTGAGYLRVLREYRLPNSDIYAMCRRIQTDWAEALASRRFRVTGDASGAARSGLSSAAGNYVRVIYTELNVPPSGRNFRKQNPNHGDSQVHCAALFEKLPDLRIDPSCKYLTEDFLQVQMKDAFKIDKSNERLGHLLDCFRYAVHAWQQRYFNRLIKS